MNTSAFALSALAGVLLAAQPAMAESVEVQYEDLDLTTKDGVKELDRRVDFAARDVCGANESTVGSRIMSRETRQCIRDAKRQIEQNIARLTKEEKAGG